MSRTYDFENIYKEFEASCETQSISHADELTLNGEYCRVTEVTVFINKDLANPKVRQDEEVKIVKKMWGSFSVLLWWCTSERIQLPKRRVFCLRVELSHSKFARILKEMLKNVEPYKNGSYTKLSFEISES